MEKYRTTSLQLAAALLCQDVKFDYDRLEMIGQSNRFQIVLDMNVEKEELDTLLKDYKNEKLRVEPKSYDLKIRTLFHDMKNQQGGF